MQIKFRKNIRLKGYDYSVNGYYFVTICVKHRIPVFGSIEHGRVILSDIGVQAHILDPDRVGRPQLYSPSDSVPVALRMVRDTMGVTADVHDQAVVHADGEPVFTGRDHRRTGVAAVSILAFVFS